MNFMDQINLDILVDIVTIVAVGIAAYGLFHNIKGNRRQANTQLFLDYTARYEAIMSSFPSEARMARLDIHADPPPASGELTLSVLKYLNLCSEEYYLYHRKYLDKDIWTIWEDELKRTVASSLIRREWPALEHEFDSYPDFKDFISGIIDASGGHSA